MRRSKFILVLTIVLVFAAGVVMGQLWARLPVSKATTPPPPTDGKPPWVSELALTAEQQKEMDAIWAETRQKIGQTFDQRRNIDKQRDEAIQSLLTEQQKIAFENIQSEHSTQRAELDKERAQIVKQAEERSRALLNDEQKKRWDAMPRGPRGPRGGPPRSPGSATHPSTRPSWPMRGERPFPGH
jgi:membrane-associated HD superfamily phosphohydrolase